MFSEMSVNQAENVRVSIQCFIYYQEKYIRQCLD